MIPYVALILAPYICYIPLRLISKDKNTVCKQIIFVFLSFFCILLCFRANSIGVDLVNYKSYYNRLTQVPYRNIFDLFSEEYGFYTLLWCVEKIFHDFRFVLIIIAIIFTWFPLFCLYSENNQHPFLVISLFIGLCPFAFYFSGLSQVSAMAFSVPIYYFSKQKKKLLVIGITCFSMLFHLSGIIMLTLYPLVNYRFKRKHFFIILFIVILTFIFKEYFFYFVATRFTKYAMYSSIAKNTSYAMLLLYFLFFCFAFLILCDETNTEISFFRGLCSIMLIIQCMAPVSHMIMRLNYYYVIFVPIIFSRVIDGKLIIRSRLKKLMIIVMTSFFMIYFLVSGINSDNLNITPYLPFWK